MFWIFTIVKCHTIIVVIYIYIKRSSCVKCSNDSIEVRLIVADVIDFTD